MSTAEEQGWVPATYLNSHSGTRDDLDLGASKAGEGKTLKCYEKHAHTHAHTHTQLIIVKIRAHTHTDTHTHFFPSGTKYNKTTQGLPHYLSVSCGQAHSPAPLAGEQPTDSDELKSI